MVERFSFMVESVVTISLFENPKNLLIANKDSLYLGRDYAASIAEIIRTGNQSYSLTSKIISRASYFADHDIGQHLPDNWMISSGSGQAIFASALANPKLRVSRRGFLSLSWAPGVLRYEQQIYRYGVTKESGRTWINFVGPKLSNHTKTTKPMKFYPPNTFAVWTVSPNDGYLSISFSIRSPSNPQLRLKTDPALLLSHLWSSLILENCSHDPNSELSQLDESWRMHLIEHSFLLTDKKR